MNSVRSILSTRTFWTALGTLITGLMALFGLTDPKYTAAVSAILGFATVVFLRDGVLESEAAAKTAVIQAAAMPAKDTALPPGGLK